MLTAVAHSHVGADLAFCGMLGRGLIMLVSACVCVYSRYIHASVQCVGPVAELARGRAVRVGLISLPRVSTAH